MLCCPLATDFACNWERIVLIKWIKKELWVLFGRPDPESPGLNLSLMSLVVLSVLGAERFLDKVRPAHWTFVQIEQGSMWAKESSGVSPFTARIGFVPVFYVRIIQCGYTGLVEKPKCLLEENNVKTWVNVWQGGMEAFFLGEEYLIGFMLISCQIYVFNCFINRIRFLPQNLTYEGEIASLEHQITT